MLSVSFAIALESRHDSPRVVLRSRMLFTALSCALSLLFCESHATAEGAPQVRFSWVRSESAVSCPDQAELEARVRARLGRDAFSPDSRISLMGTVERVDRTWRAELRVSDENGVLAGHRELTATADDCGPLGDAVVLALALTIDPDAASENQAPVSPSSPSARGETSSVPGLTAVAPIAVAPSSPPPAPVSMPAAPEPAKLPAAVATQFEARAVIAFGVLPKVAPGAAVAGSFGVEWLRLTAGLSLLPETETTDGRFAFGLTTGSVGACSGKRLTPALEASLCGELSLGAMHAVVLDASQLEPLDAGEHFWGAFALGPRVALTRKPVVLALGIQAVIPFFHNQFAVQGHEAPIFEGASVAAHGYLAAGFGDL